MTMTIAICNIQAGELKMKKVLCIVGSQKMLTDYDENSSASMKVDGELIPGATISIAQKIKETIEEYDSIVEVKTAVETFNINDYDLIIIGSGIYGGQIHESIKTFVSKYKSILDNKNLAVFAVCGTLGAKDNKKREHGINIYSKKIKLGLNPEYIAVFGGTVEDTGRFSNWLGKLVIGAEPGDYRNFNDVENWARTLIEINN